MRGVNKVILVGAVGRDPEARSFSNGGQVVSFSMATNESFKDRHGDKQERAEWHNISAFGKLAEIINQYVHKGDPLYLEGKIRTEKYTDKNGNERYATKIIANEIRLLGGKRNEPSRHGAQQQSTPPAQASAEFEDDIPF